MLRRVLLAGVLILLPFLLPDAGGKEQPPQTITWPEAGAPILRFTFSKFKEIGGLGNQRTFMTETTAENLWTKIISNANFSLYLFDKNKVRIGEATIAVSNVRPGETIKFETTISASGPPASLSIVARYLPPELGPAAPAKTISLTVNSVPQGAALKVDDNETGETPKIVKFSVGKHMLEFSKEGFNPGRFPLEVGADDASGGSVSYELGASAHDTIELRDGTVLSGDLESISATEVVVRAGGKDLSYDRNQVKRIMLVQREQLPQTPAHP
ncbi:MAG: PEGA domain-containing protein [Candidatus Sulfotelmatobacter sp.]